LSVSLCVRDKGSLSLCVLTIPQKSNIDYNAYQKIKSKLSSHLEQRKTFDKKYIDLIILVINPFETFKTNFRYVGNTYKYLFLLAHSLPSKKTLPFLSFIKYV
jgi:hypothetical protein